MDSIIKKEGKYHLQAARPNGMADLTAGILDGSAFLNADRAERLELDQVRRGFRRDHPSRLYDQEEKSWYQRAYAECLVFMYDKSFYDGDLGRYRIEELLDEGEKEFGGYDILSLWQSYPRLGIDRRNQFDFYRDMPGGLEALKDVVRTAHLRGVKVFINYNPWDTETRREAGEDADVLAAFLDELDADGVFLDTMRGADPEFVRALEKTGRRIVLDPEGKPYTEDYARFTGGWLQMLDPSLKYAAPPYLPAIRWLEPRFSFRGTNRTLESNKEHISICFFHGYGHIIWENIYGWWNPWNAEDRNIFKKCVWLLRRYHEFFIDPDWQPYVHTGMENVYAHQWSEGTNKAFTLLNRNGTKVERIVLETEIQEGQRCFDLWNGKELTPLANNGSVSLEVVIEAESAGFIVISEEEELPKWERICCSAESDYRKRPGLEACLPRPVVPTPGAEWGGPFTGMVHVKGRRYCMSVFHGADGCMEGACYGSVDSLYSKEHPVQYFWMQSYFMDRYEVTNLEYREFLQQSCYQPKVMTHFLEHWEKPEHAVDKPWLWKIPRGKENHPVVWVDLEDARAYAGWAGKRLPTEAEWQYAAQGTDGRMWPWGEDYRREYCNGDSQDTAAVDQYPQGDSPFGCGDMCGNVWEWTESERDDGHTRYAVLKGGSHYKIKGSSWYVSSGAQPCGAHEKMLLMYPGLDRCGTVGFRCVKDPEW